MDCESNLVADGHPFISQIVPPAENLQIVSVGHKLFNVLINFFWFLALSASIAEDDVPGDPVLHFLRFSFHADEAGFFCVLQIVSVAFCDLSVDCLFDPGDGVHEAVAPLFHQLDSEGVLRVDCPDQQNPAFLQFRHWYLFDELIGERVILYGHSARGLRGGQFPRWVHHDHVEEAL